MSDESQAQPAQEIPTSRVLPIHTILVPLDGSERAEQALGVAELLAQKLGSTLLLVRVVPLVSLATAMASQGQVMSPEAYELLYESEERAARAYLDAQAEQVRSRTKVSVRTLMVRGEAARSLADGGSAEHADLIVMTTHGRTGLARLALGSVADELIREGSIPVLLLRSFKGVSPPLEVLSRALVALDGSARAEAALRFVLRLAGPLVCDVEVIQVIAREVLTPPPTNPLGAVTPAATPVDATAAGQFRVVSTAEYLEGVAQRYAGAFAARRCAFRTRIVEGNEDDIAGAIVAVAQEGPHFVAMATRGHGGLTRLALGSVAERVLKEGASPLLLMRAD